MTCIRIKCAHCEHLAFQHRWRAMDFYEPCIFNAVIEPEPSRKKPKKSFPTYELTSYPWQFKVPFFQRFTSETGYFSAQTKSDQMNVLHVDAVFDQEANETCQIACNSWYISYGIYIPAGDRYSPSCLANESLTSMTMQCWATEQQYESKREQRPRKRKKKKKNREKCHWKNLSLNVNWIFAYTKTTTEVIVPKLHDYRQHDSPIWFSFILFIHEKCFITMAMQSLDSNQPIWHYSQSISGML